VDERAIFRLHWGVALEEEDDSHREEMIQHVKDLQSKAIRYEQKMAAGAIVISSKCLNLSLSLKFILLNLYQFHLEFCGIVLFAYLLWYLNFK
jgi:hypothetical protein